MFALLAAIVLQSSTAATQTKQYATTFGSSVASATTTPVTGTAGDGYVTLTITNETRQPNTLGSANVTVQSGVTITGTDAGAGNLDATQTFTSSTSTLKLRNLNVANGKTFTTNVYVNAPDCTTFTWSSQAKQSNDFSGSGNDFQFDPSNSSVSTFNPSGCHLSWTWTTDGGVAHQPANAVVGAVITNTAYQPTIGNGVANVAVGVVDANGALVDISGPVVTLTPSSSSSPFVTGTNQATVTHGVATFTGLKGGTTATGLTVTPTSTGSGLANAPASGPFDITTSGESCNGGACPEFPTVLDNTGNTSLLSSSDGGTFKFMGISSLHIPDGQCDNWKNLSENAHWHGGAVDGFVETEGRIDNTPGNKTFKNFVSQKAIQANYGANVGQQLIPICAGGQRIDSSGNPIPCASEDPHSGWWGESLGANGGFTGVLKQATCKSDGIWWGVLASFQDRNNTNFDGGPPPAGFSWDTNPLVTSWSSCTSTGATDPLCPGIAGTTYREFEIFVPDPWDWRSGP